MQLLDVIPSTEQPDVDEQELRLWSVNEDPERRIQVARKLAKSRREPWWRSLELGPASPPWVTSAL